ncbi:MAG TPA: hypothetical protein DCO65_10165 [Spartobacteria bacterium]|jgi:hypothetical protein|nr:hypothetical protein [Spartobacteria bacterium]
MKREDDEQLWDLLGRAAEPKLSPFFARNVLRQVRQEPRAFERVRSWLSWRRLVPASGLALAVIAAIIAFHQPASPQHPSEREPDVVAKVDPQDYEVVADLDELLASDDNNLWEENSTL